MRNDRTCVTSKLADVHSRALLHTMVQEYKPQTKPLVHINPLVSINESIPLAESGSWVGLKIPCFDLETKNIISNIAVIISVFENRLIKAGRSI